MQKPERSKNLGCGFVDGSMDGCVVKGGNENVAATPGCFFLGGKGSGIWVLGFGVG